MDFSTLLNGARQYQTKSLSCAQKIKAATYPGRPYRLQNDRREY